MKHEVSGHTDGLKVSHKRLLERTYLKRVSSKDIVSQDLAKHMSQVSFALRRMVGVLINRRGHIEEVFVGTAERLFLPEVGRARAHIAHRRGLRHVHTRLVGTGLASDDETDLVKLRLDAVAVIDVGPHGEPQAMAWQTLQLLPNAKAQAPIVVRDVFQCDFDFLAHIEALEQEERRHQSRPKTSTTKLLATVIGVFCDKKEADGRLSEMRELARTAGVDVVHQSVQIKRQPDPKYVLGKGKLEEVVLSCLDNGSELLIVENNLSPTQARSMAALTDLKVIDRTQLILDIFAQHAKSRDGKLQVELAQLEYTLPRLTDMDAGLSRLTGGIGGRGPGETKLELKRRSARQRMHKLERQISQISQQRHLRRHKREHTRLAQISLVGYTNAGKSTLMRALTHSDVWVADQLFATLDATSRKLRLPDGRWAVLTDTVGFIRDLPAALIKAFRATLEELMGADVLLHVIDISDPELISKRQSVEALLKSLDLETITPILVLNKADCLAAHKSFALSQREGGVAISAQSGEGVKTLLDAIQNALAGHSDAKKAIVGTSHC